MRSPTSWTDLGPRLIAAIVLAVVAVLAILQGGWVLAGLVVVFSALMVAELWLLVRRAGLSLGHQLALSAASAAIIGLAAWVHFSALTGRAFAEGLQPEWQLGLWLILVVIATDVAGYFGGKTIGGPKLSPRLSPNKTWSGTLSGWLAALCVSAGMVWLADWSGLAKWLLAALMVSIASQASDLLESAIKRRLGVKDSSNLIPGHGGFCDRLDGMIGGAYGLLLALAVLGLAQGWA